MTSSTVNLGLTEGLKHFKAQLDTQPGVAQEAKLVSPRGYKLLVRMYSLPDKTSGGLYIPEKDKDLHNSANICAQVLAMGDMAYNDPKRYSTPWCNVGDWVLIRQYTGTRFHIKGDAAEYRTIDDDNVEAVVSDPNLVTRDLGIHG